MKVYKSEIAVQTGYILELRLPANQQQWSVEKTSTWFRKNGEESKLVV